MIFLWEKPSKKQTQQPSTKYDRECDQANQGYSHLPLPKRDAQYVTFRIGMAQGVSLACGALDNETASECGVTPEGSFYVAAPYN
jgi:hypothetical protein